ncbi:MAG: hypothetical protein IJZ25_02140, partial [Lachnospiraceae bacterium]|nr:hypothetical protein [Lachnospiraceae bacterium]
RKKYVPVVEDKLETLRKLDRGVENRGTMMSVITGVIGTLVLGAGMSMVMVMNEKVFMVLGIILGIIGIAVMAVAYPVYNRIVKKQREKIAPQVLALTEDLMR